MTDKPTPKEIDDLVYELRQTGKDDTYSLASAVLAKWGTPATGGEPAGTVGYTVHGTQYVNWRTKPPAHGTPLYTTPQPTQPQAAEPVAWAFKYDDGTWHDPSTTEHSPGMRPLCAAPQPVARMPLDEARRLFDAGWKAAALFCDREDVVADGITGFGACPQFEAAFSAANGIKGGQHG